MRALRRDHSRCRGCDTKGDEITLYIHLIEPGAHDLDSLVTLCVQCEHLANEMKLQSASIPDFLRQLWRYLHHSNQAVQNQVRGLAVVSSPSKSMSQPDWSASEYRTLCDSGVAAIE
jgi:cytochrome c553